MHIVGKALSDPYYKLLDILKLYNIFKLNIAALVLIKFLTILKECIPVIFSDFVLPAASIHSHNTRYASDQNLIYRIHVRTNYEKFTFKYRAALIWETIPKELKSLKIVLSLKGTVKPFYYKTNDSETAHNPLFFYFFSFLFSLNNAGIAIYNYVILFSFFLL